MAGKRGARAKFQRHQAKRLAAAIPEPSAPRPEAEILCDLQMLCRHAGFAHIVAHVIVRDNFIFYAEEMTPDDMGNMFGFNRLIRTEITTLIGYMVQGGPEAFGELPVDPQALLDRAEALLEELHKRLSWLGFEELREGSLDALEQTRLRGEALREPIFYGGESAFSFQYQDFATAKYHADNAWLTEKKGFTIEQAEAVVDAILRIQEGELTSLRVKNAPPLPGFIVSSATVQSRSGLPVDTVNAVLDALAIPLGSNQKFTALNDFNQAHASPLISLGDGRYVAFLYYCLVEALYDAPFYWMVDDTSYRDTAAKNRGNFTEAFSLQRFEQVFGAANVHRGVNLERAKGDTVGEIDILVEFGGRLLVIQAKSKRLTLSARRGNEGSLQADFKAAVQDAYDQALSCADALLDPAIRLVDVEGKVIRLRNPASKIYPICLVSDHYPALVTQVDRFLVLREVAGVARPLVTDIFALDALCELLDRPLRLIGYCELRDRFSDKLIYSHEVVLLAFHLRQNLWLGDNYDGMLLDDTFVSTLEIAMLARRRGIPGAKTPSGPLTAFVGSTFEAVLARIESRPEPAMVDLALNLLEASGASIGRFNQGARMVFERTRADGRQHDFSIGMGADTGLTIHCSLEDNEAARARLEAHAVLRKYATKTRRWFGLFLSPEDGLPIAGLMLEYPWVEDAETAKLAFSMEAAARAKPIPPGMAGVMRAPSIIPGRNDRCPCQSGRKFKKCCGL